MMSIKKSTHSNYKNKESDWQQNRISDKKSNDPHNCEFQTDKFKALTCAS